MMDGNNEKYISILNVSLLPPRPIKCSVAFRCNFKSKNSPTPYQSTAKSRIKTYETLKYP